MSCSQGVCSVEGLRQCTPAGAHQQIAAPVAAPVAGAAPAALDPVVQSAVERARTRFLATQTFKRLNLSVWVQDAPGQPWRGGEVDAAAQVYPASIVKLPFAVSTTASVPGATGASFAATGFAAFVTVTNSRPVIFRQPSSCSFSIVA